MSNRAFAGYCRILLIITIGLGSFAAAGAQTTVANAANQISEFDVNGMKVLIKRRQGTPTVAAGLFFRGGVRNETTDNIGVEGFALSAATEGSKDYPRQKLRKATSRVGTGISSFSSYDYSGLSLASTKQNFDISWQIFVDVALNPTFAADDVKRLREQIITAMRSESDDPDSLLENSVEKVVYAGHPYANDPKGTIENIAKLSPADLAAYHRKLLETSRMLLVIVGDVDPDVLQKQITVAFGKLPRGSYKDAAMPAINFAAPTLDVTSKALPTDYVKGTFGAPSLRDPDYYAMQAAIAILQKQVFDEVRVKRNLSYAPEASMGSLSANTGSIYVTSVDPNQSVMIMLSEIQKLKQEPVGADRTGEIAGDFLTTYYTKQETNAAQAGELARYELIGGGWRNSLEFLTHIRKIQPAEIQAVANKYMKNIRFVVVGNPADVNRSIFLRN